MGKGRTTTTDSPISRRFRFVREIGAGGGGTVYLVEDRVSPPTEKALKIVPAGTGARPTLLRREFDVLRQLRHPGLVPVFDFGQSGGSLWFTSEYVAGPDLFAASASWGFSELETAFETLLETLQFLHERGILHNDLKASNTRVPSGPRSVRLLDFGLASVLTGGPLTGGTPPYMAPERLRRPGSPGSVRADLYGLGVVLYRCLTRRLPFEGEEPDVLLPAIEAGPVPPRALRSDIPHYLEAILRRMLDPDPERRPATTTELLAEMATHRPERPRREASVITLPTAPLLDRDGLLAELEKAWTQARAADAQWLLLTGEAGIGKSRLLTELKQRIELAGGAVVDTQVEPGALRPWALLAGILRRLAALPLAPAAPAGLDDLLATTPGSSRRGVGLEVRDAFARYLTACARATPVAILVDDLSWGDAESVRSVVTLPDQPRQDLSLLVVATSRDQPGSAGHPPRCDEPPWRVIAVPPLSEDAQRKALASFFPSGDVSESQLADALGQASGNPLALAEIARLWVETGAVKRVGGRWAGAPRAARATGGKPLEIIAARLRALPEDSASLVRLVALRGRSLPTEIAARLVPGAQAAVPRLVRAGLLIDGPSGLDVKHPMVREAAIAIAPAREIRAAHGRLAGALEAAGVPPGGLWQHLLRGDATARGLPLALAAGVDAEQMEDFATGRIILEEVVERARAHPEALDEGDRTRLHLSLATCLTNTGVPQKAIELLEQAVESSSRAARTPLAVRLATALVYTGDRARSDQILRRLRTPPDEPAVEAELAFARGMNHVAHGRFEAAQDSYESVLRLAAALKQDVRGTKLLVEAYQRAVPMAARPAAALRYLDEAIRLAEQAGLVGQAAFARAHRAAELVWAGRLDEALLELREIEPTLETGSNANAWVVLRRYQAWALHHLGRTAEAVSQLRSIEERGSPRGKRNTAANLAEALADVASPEGLELARRLAVDLREGREIDEGDMAIAAGLRAALWLGRSEHVDDLGRQLRPADGSTPVARPENLAAHGTLALLRGDLGAGIRLLGEAAALAPTLFPLLEARTSFHFAHALALGGRTEDARRAAADSGRAYARLGNAVEAARAHALGEAIAAGRIGPNPRPIDWQTWLADAATDLPAPAEPGTLLCEAVARAVDATGAWLAVGEPGKGRIVARSGPCAAADPIAWRVEIEAAIAETKVSERPGVGIVLPASHDGAPAALVIEDRAFPGAFRMPGAARLAVARFAAELDRRRLRADLDLARRALDRPPRSAAPVGATATTAPSPGRSSSKPLKRSSMNRDVRTLLELSLGPVELRHSFDAIIGRSTEMRRALQLLDRMVDMEANVLIVGETGTGKELVARAIHEQGPRAAGPFVAVNCSAVPPALAESEFFGHQPGAFTGAARTRHRGYFEQADAGTLFLDEIGELEPALQAKLLRALEEGEIRPMGGERPLKVDVRVVSATNRDLREETAAGRFRSDLFYRLAVVELKLPALRERSDDIPVLARHLLAALHDPPPTLSPDALDALAAYSWPGNVRQLRNELERAVAFVGAGTIQAQHLSPAVRAALEHHAPPARTLREAVGAVECRLIQETLRACNGNRTEAARRLGVSRNGLYVRLRKYQRTGKMPRAARPRLNSLL